ADADRLARKDNLYDFIIEIDHNTRPRVAGRGSAVFIHAARQGFTPTAGCVALEINSLRRILARLGPRTRIVLDKPLPGRSYLARSPNIALPTRTWVAPSAIAAEKSALIPIDNNFRPLRFAILAVSAKWGPGASSRGGMHMRPEILSPNWSRHAARKPSASCGSTPAFCVSAPVLISTKRTGCRFCFPISFPSASHKLTRPTEWMQSNRATASFALLD